MESKSCIEKPVSTITSYSNKIVLVVDDIQINYLLIKALMKPTGATILWANDGAKAVKLIDSGRKVDLIFMDYHMPDMNGHEATLLIKNRKTDIPVISQTTFTHENELNNTQEIYDDILMKPITSSTLFNILNKHL